MTIALDRAARHPAASSTPAGIAVAGATLLVGTAWHMWGYANTDIAGLLTVGSHMLDGAEPYRDLFEINPPGSVLLYMPALLIGRTFGLDAQAVALALTGLACAACLAACAAVLRPAVPPALRGPLVVATAAVLVLVPMGSFGQREHLILMASLPLLCRMATGRDGGAGRAGPPSPFPGLLPGLLAGAAAGIGLSIKPFYALGLVGPALLLARSAGWRGLLRRPDLRVAGSVAAASLGAQLLLFPAFTHDVLPLLGRVYLPMRLPLLRLFTLTGGAASSAALIGCALVRPAMPASGVRNVLDTAATAALGFFVAYLLQGKGWAYHTYPCTAVALIGLGAGALSFPLHPLRSGIEGSPVGSGSPTRLQGIRNRFGLAQGAGPRRLRPMAARVGAAALAGWAALGFDLHMDIDAAAPGLAAAVADLGPHPRVMSLAPDVAVGHPLVRRVGGIWVGTLMSSWIHAYVDRIAPGQGRGGPLGPDLAFEDRTFASDIHDKRPDAVLAVAPGWDRWIAEAPDTAAALAPYRRAGTYGEVVLWTRKP